MTKNAKATLMLVKVVLIVAIILMLIIAIRSTILKMNYPQKYSEHQKKREQN